MSVLTEADLDALPDDEMTEEDLDALRALQRFTHEVQVRQRVSENVYLDAYYEQLVNEVSAWCVINGITVVEHEPPDDEDDYDMLYGGCVDDGIYINVTLNCTDAQAVLFTLRWRNW